MTTREERLNNLSNNPMIKLAIQYATDNKDAYFALKQYDTTDYKGNPIKSRIPPPSAKEWVYDVPFFKEFGELVYRTYFENQDITFDLKDHYYKDGTKLSDVQSKVKEWNEFSKESILESIIFDFSYFLDSYINDPDDIIAIAQIASIFRANSLKLTDGLSCPDCGQRIQVYFDFDDNKLVLPSHIEYKVDVCPISDDDEQIIKFKVNVPSGKLIFDNDLRGVLSKEIEDRMYKYDINTFLGEKQHTEAYANESGLIYCFVGNTCPTVAKLADDEIIIGSTWQYGEMVHGDEEWEFPEEQVQGTICTDLWAFCAMDYDLFKEHQKENGSNFEEHSDQFIVDVESGEYEIIHYYSSKVQKPYFTKIKRINEDKS